MKQRIVVFVVLLMAAIGLAVGLICAYPSRLTEPLKLRNDETYRFASARFDRFVKDSYDNAGAGSPGDFYTWINKAYTQCPCKYRGKESLSIKEVLMAQNRAIRSTHNLKRQAESEIIMGAWLHRLVKSVIPKFSLDRGFEFRYTVTKGERQCFLQSVLISSMLQSMGANTGVVMVYKSITGRESNNGHAVVLLKLPTGRDIIVDASEPEPFAKQQGLFVRTTDYQYVEPVYLDDSSKIIYYKAPNGGDRISTSEVRPLDYSFLQSQFYYYRGERADGALMASKVTARGLKLAENYLQTSIKFCPKNPLSVYTLGRVYLKEGRKSDAKRLVTQACKLYQRFGWLPSGPQEYLKLVNRG